MRNYLMILVLLAILSTASANTICSKLLTSSSKEIGVNQIIGLGNIIKSVEAGEGVTHRDVMKHVMVFFEIHRKIISQSKTVEKWEPISLHISNCGEFTCCRGDQIYTTNRYSLLMEYSNQSSSVSKYNNFAALIGSSITAHEHGHFVLESILIKRISGFMKIVNLARDAAKLGDKKKKVKVELEKYDLALSEHLIRYNVKDKKYAYYLFDKFQNRAQTDEEFIKEGILIYSKREKVLSDRRRLIKIGNNINSEVLKIVSLQNFLVIQSYFEFFADSIAVMYMDNYPRAVFDVLPRVVQSSDNRAIVSRDLSDESNRIDNWDETFDEHEMMSPTGYHLYENYLRLPKYNSNKGRGLIYDGLLFSIEMEARFILENPNIELTSKEWNQRLMDRLDSVLHP